jgi:signal transduction histidine kinase
MVIKKRLILSYLGMLIIPIILSIVASYLIGYYYIGDVAGDYNFHFRGNPFKSAQTERNHIFNQLKAVSIKNRSKLEDPQYLGETADRLKPLSSFVVIRKEKEIIYSSLNMDQLDIEESLPSFGQFAQSYKLRSESGRIGFVLNQHDFHFENNAEGSLFIILDLRPIKLTFIRFILTLSVVVLIILTSTNGIMTYLVSRSITNPLGELKNAADQIKEGNLDIKLKTPSKDEIGELTMAFEEMRKRLKTSVELQLQYENNRKELISNISHDLKTPITAIKGYVEGIIDGVADTPEKMSKYVNTIYSKAVDIDDMIDELFLFSKLDLKKLPFNFDKIDILKYLKDSVEELQFDVEHHNAKIFLEMSEEHGIFVMADREKLKRVIVNIVENSVKYMDKALVNICIRIKGLDEFVQIEIQDNGKGIAQRDLPYIFDRFYRVDTSRNSSTGGSGLGLAIAKRIIEEHGGHMEAQSQEGHGTTIIFTLKRV